MSAAGEMKAEGDGGIMRGSKEAIKTDRNRPLKMKRRKREC